MYLPSYLTPSSEYPQILQISVVSEKVLQHCPTCSTKAVWQKQAEKCRHCGRLNRPFFFLQTQIQVSIAKLEVSGGSRVQTEVHRSIFGLPPAPGLCISSGSAGKCSRKSQVKVNIAGEAREAELVPRRCSACSRGDGMAGVPSLAALSVTCSPAAAPAPDQGPPSGSHLAPTPLLYKSSFAAQ